MVGRRLGFVPQMAHRVKNAHLRTIVPAKPGRNRCITIEVGYTVMGNDCACVSGRRVSWLLAVSGPAAGPEPLPLKPVLVQEPVKGSAGDVGELCRS